MKVRQIAAPDRDDVTDRVARFYNELPFNYLGAKDSAALVRDVNQIEAYADLDAILRQKHGASVLDVGCGAGWFANTCAYHYGHRVRGIDLSQTALARARETSAALGVDDRTRFDEVSLFEVRPDERYDVVNSLGVLHHTHSVPEGLRTIAPLVADGGVLHVGLYHLYGRRPFLQLFERYRVAALAGELSEADEQEALALYAELHPQADDPEFLRSWFRDQVIHPHETQHSLEEVAGLMGGLGLEIVTTSINRFEPYARLEDLFVAEREYEEVSRRRNVEEKRYFPGFFTFLARRSAER